MRPILTALLTTFALAAPVLAQQSALGPADGRDLDALEIDRVQVGQRAPEVQRALRAIGPVR